MVFSDNLSKANWMQWPETAVVMDVFAKENAAARFVGGCVRDGLLGLSTEDVDICTPLRPDDVVALMQAGGHKAIPTGIKHGTVTIVINHRHFEITTLRVDVKTFGRHAEVAFTDDWELDAHRRDFTMNALYADADGRIYDPVGGIDDLKRGLIRFVGTAEKRITEDRLRVLRFFRFFARFGKTDPDPASLKACQAAAQDLSNLAPERIQKELLRLLATPDPVPSATLMYDAGVLRALLPAAGNIARLDRLVKSGRSADPVIRLAALLGAGQEVAEQTGQLLRLSRKDRLRLLNMSEVDFNIDIDRKAARRWFYRLGAPSFEEQAMLLLADNPDHTGFAEILAGLKTWQPSEFPVKARDFMDLGMTAGPELGIAMRSAEEWWVAEDFEPAKAEIMAKFALPV